MHLTSEQLAQFNKDGFIVLRGFLDEKRCDEITKIAQEHLREKIEPIETETGYYSKSRAYRTDVTDYNSYTNEEHVVVRRLRQVYGRDILFKNWMKEKSIRPVLQQILGGQVTLVTAHHNSIMTKMPHISAETGWHQDRRYWRYSDNDLVSIWLALDDETNQNGALEFIPGSHTMHFTAEQFDEKEYFSKTYGKNDEILARKVATDLKKGDVVIFHSLLLHRANKNCTDRPKISFVYTVKSSHTKALQGTRSSEYPEIVLEKV